MTKLISGKVARVLNAREIAINVGSIDGVLVGMLFEVMDTRHINITDPDTEERLGSIVRPKVRVKIIEVHNRLSVATTYRTEKADISTRLGGGVSFSSRIETLEKGGKLGDEPDEIDESESYVKTGDQVIQIIETTYTESADDTDEPLTEVPTKRRGIKAVKNLFDP